MRLGYADPPYPGNAHRYKDHRHFDGEVDHLDLLQRLESDYDGWVLHTGSNNLPYLFSLFGELGIEGYRTMAWVKPFAAFKRNISVAYAWEPVFVKPVRKPEVTKRIPDLTMRDWLAESITLKKGLTGVKPEKVCWWLFEVAGLQPEDTMHDMFPGTYAVTRAWLSWKKQIRLAQK